MEPTPQVPSKYLQSESNKFVIHKLVSELNSLHCLGLGEQPNLTRGVCLPRCNHGSSRLVLVGTSHTAKIAALIRPSEQVTCLPLPAQTLPPGSVAALSLKVAELKLGKKDILIIDILSSTVYMSSDEMGMPVAAFQSEPWKYHISGYLETAPYAMLKRHFTAIRPILKPLVMRSVSACCRCRPSSRRYAVTTALTSATSRIATSRTSCSWWPQTAMTSSPQKA